VKVQPISGLNIKKTFSSSAHNVKPNKICKISAREIKGGLEIEMEGTETLLGNSFPAVRSLTFVFRSNFFKSGYITQKNFENFNSRIFLIQLSTVLNKDKMSTGS
jgi:hypothetical protein